MKNQPHIALEITSKSVRIAVGNEVNGKIYILDLIEKDCNGIQNGFIVDNGIVVNTIKSILNQIQNRFLLQNKTKLLQRITMLSMKQLMI